MLSDPTQLPLGKYLLLNGISLSFPPSNIKLKEMSAAPLGPRSEELRKMLANELLLDSRSSLFSTKLIECFRRFGFAVAYDSSLNSQLLSDTYQIQAELFQQDQTYLNQFGSPAPGREDGYIPPDTEVSVSAIGEGLQSNVFQFIHRTGRNDRNVPGELGEKFANASSGLMTMLYGQALHVAEAISKGLRDCGFLGPDGKQLADDHFITLMTESDGEKSSLTLLRLTHCRAMTLNENNTAGCSMAHSDLNAFTILPTATQEGLQIWVEDSNDPTSSGWVQLDAPPNSYIINVADQLDIITRGFLRSTPHRVVAPLGQDRYSQILFVGFNRSLDLEAAQLQHPQLQNSSNYLLETQPRIKGIVTAERFTDLRKMDIQIIPEADGVNLGLIPLSQLEYMRK